MHDVWQWLAVLFGGAWVSTMGFIANAMLRDRKAAGERSRAETAATVEVTRIGAAERMTNELLERLYAEIAESRRHQQVIEVRDDHLRTILYALLSDLQEMRGLMGRNCAACTTHEHLNEKRVAMEERVQRARELWGEGVA